MADTASHRYRTRGFVVFRQALDRSLVEDVARSEEEVVRPYHGPLLRHDNRMTSHDFYSSSGLTPLERCRSGLAHAHVLKNSPIQPFVDAFVRLLTSDSMFDCFHKIDSEERYTLHQTLFFFTSPLTVLHLDRMTLDTTPLGGSFIAWIPIDRVHAENGPVYVVPRPAGKYESDEELGVVPTDDSGAMRVRHRTALARKLYEDGVELVAPSLNPGDLLVFAPSTPHGSFPPMDANLRRRSVQAIYRPTRYTQWGGYPNHHESHETAAEEDRVSDHFNFLKIDS